MDAVAVGFVVYLVIILIVGLYTSRKRYQTTSLREESSDRGLLHFLSVLLVKALGCSLDLQVLPTPQDLEILVE